MLPRELLPISDEAAMAAHEAYHARLATQKVDETYVAMPAAIRAFLAAEEFKVEKMTADPQSATQFVPQLRLVSPWKPAPSSTESMA